jgi:hypothetical protein
LHQSQIGVGVRRANSAQRSCVIPTAHSARTCFRPTSRAARRDYIELIPEHSIQQSYDSTTFVYDGTGAKILERALPLLFILMTMFPPLAAAHQSAGNNAAVRSMAATQARSAVRLGFATPGDGRRQVFASDTRAQIISGSGHSVTVVTPSSYKMPSDPDDSNSIIAALATCKSVEFAANTTYTISKPLPLCPGGKQKIFRLWRIQRHQADGNLRCDAGRGLC